MKCEKWTDQHTEQERGKKKESESPTGIESMTSRNNGTTWEVMGSIHVRADSDVFFVPRSWHENPRLLHKWKLENNWKKFDIKMNWKQLFKVKRQQF